MPTKLLSTTLNKSDTHSSHMLSYQFTKEAFGKEKDGFLETNDYQNQLKSLQDTMKVIREMEDEHSQV